MSNLKMFEGHFAELKTMLAAEDDFLKTYKYFLDNMGENPGFMTLGKTYNSPDLKKIIQVVGKGFLGDDASVTNILTKRIQEQQFINGICKVNGKFMVFFLFKDIGMGLAVMADLGGRVNTVRFTTFESPNKLLTLHSVSGASLH